MNRVGGSRSIPWFHAHRLLCTIVPLVSAFHPGLARDASSFPLFDAPFLSFNSVPRPYVVVAGDLNRDGRPDVALGGTGNVTVLMGRGDGSFEHRATLSGSASSLALGNMNGDVWLDLVTNSSVFLNRGDGTFGAGISFGSSSAIALGDMDRDGRLDIVANQGDRVSVYLGNGDGTAHLAGSTSVQLLELAVAVGDLDGDGILDAAVPHGRSLSMHPCYSTLRGRGDGTLELPQGHDVCGVGHPWKVRIGDVDGNGTAEVATDVLAIQDLDGDSRNDKVTGFGTTQVSVSLGQPGGGFAPAGDFFVGNRLSDVAVADFNRDGKVDLAVATWGCDVFSPIVCDQNAIVTSFSVLLGKGGGIFGGHGIAVAMPNAGSTAGGDLDGDGDGDLVTIGSNGSASVRPSETGTARSERSRAIRSGPTPSDCESRIWISMAARTS